jgi:replicative DNA helicase
MKHRDRRATTQELQPPPIAGRVPPHDLDAEAAVLSAVLLEADALAKVRLVLGREDFYSEPNQRIFEACCSIADEPTIEANGHLAGVDVVTVASWLRARGWLAQCGGPAYLAQIIEATPGVANVSAHAKIVAELGAVRRWMAHLQLLAAQCYGDEVRQDPIGSITAGLAALTTQATSSRKGSTDDTTEEIFQAMAAEGAEESDVRVSTGIEALDALAGPLEGGECVGVLAYSGQGKSAFVSSMGARVGRSVLRARCAVCKWEGINPGIAVQAHAWHVHCPRCQRGCSCKGRLREETCDAQGLRPMVPQGVVIFTSEFPKQRYLMRVVASLAGIPAKRVRSILRGVDKVNELVRIGDERDSRWAAERIQAVEIAVQMVRSKYFRIVDTARTIEDAVAEVRATRARWASDGVRIRMMALDYLQRYGSSAQHGNREAEVAHVARTWKNLCLEVDAPGLLLAQLNKDGRKEKREPRARDSRESEAAYQEFDRAIVLWNQERDEASLRFDPRRDDVEDPMPPERCTIILDKSREGRTGSCKAAFHPTATSFTDWDRSWGEWG